MWVRSFGPVLVLSMAAAAQDLVDLPWKLGEDGRLLVQSSIAEGPWLPMFAGLLEQRVGDKPPRAADMLNYGPFMLLPLLLTGDGGGAALDEAELRLRKLGIRMGLRSDLMGGAHGEPFEELLRVRYLAGVEVAAVSFLLADCARDKGRDPFVRAAAAAAAATRPGFESAAEEMSSVRAKRNGAAALQAGLMQLPDDFDLLIGMHSVALPTAAKLLAGWRRWQLRLASTVLLEMGASIAPDQVVTGQLRFDFPGQLPCELAVRFGNWRVDHALVALRCGEPDQWWFHLGGVFQPQKIAEGLQKSGFEVRVGAGDEIRATVEGWELRATATELEGLQVGAAVASRGKHVATLHGKAAPDAPPVWLHVPATSRLAQRLTLPLAGLDATFGWPTMRLSGEARCADAAAAEVVRRRWDEWRDARRFEPEGLAPGERKVTWKEIAGLPPGVGEPYPTALVWRRCVQATKATSEGDRVVWACDLSAFTADDLVRLLGVPPLALEKHY